MVISWIGQTTLLNLHRNNAHRVPINRARICRARGRHTPVMSESDASLRFAVVADVQYGDRDDYVKQTPSGVKRRLAYRASLERLQAAIQALNRVDGLSCIVSVGDIIEGALSGKVDDSVREAKGVLSVFAASRVPVHHVIGNHCRSIPLADLWNMLGMGSPGYKDIRVAPGWRFVLLNGAELNLAAVDATPSDAEALRRLMDESIENFQGPDDDKPSRLIPRYYGGIGSDQLAWFRSVLSRAADENERVVVFCHYPLAENATRGTHVLINGHAVVRAMEEHPGLVRCVFAGHDHLGGCTFSESGSAGHITVQAMLESAPGEGGNAFAVVTGRGDGSMQIEGIGSVPCYSVPASAEASADLDGETVHCCFESNTPLVHGKN
jgi:Calcineurin-like phosphoesterase